MLNEIGILIEIVGASLILVTAWRSRKKSFVHVGDNINKIGPAVDFLLDEMRGAFRAHALGFAFLVVGLLLQLISAI